MKQMAQQSVKQLPKIMWWLGYGGLIPFLILTGALLWGFSVPFLQHEQVGWWLAVYAAAVLSFVGAVHWAVALGIKKQLKGPELAKLLVFSLLPTAVAWFSLLTPTHFTLFILAGLIVFIYIGDSVLLFNRIAPGYDRMRLQLTIIVALLLLAAGIAVF